MSDMKERYDELLKLCDVWFNGYWETEYSSGKAVTRCKYCGAVIDIGRCHHSVADCPVVKYKEIIAERVEVKDE